ncbi:MAG: transcriptional repressor [Nitrospirae bacterium]|nr:transcriptional repressor [Nitrospirota bacterium]
MNETLEDVTTIFTDFLAKKNLRMTNQRNLILKMFLSTEKHVSSDDLYSLIRKQDNTIGQATVYRTLKLLAEAEIATIVEFGDGVARYEHIYLHQHHDHLICEGCNIHIEVVDDDIERLQVRLAKKYGFTLTSHKMYLYGKCEKCQNISSL